MGKCATVQRPRPGSQGQFNSVSRPFGAAYPHTPGFNMDPQILTWQDTTDLPGILELCEVVHLSGTADEPWLREIGEALPAGLRSRYHLYGYMHEETPWAMAAADLGLCRSGASTLGELPAVGLPAILVPYPYAGGHQRLNARYLERNGAAVL